MKRFKSGFSLAEVLLALAIVAIIATLGFTMSRKGIERAYNQYIYTGYNALSIAIADANANGKYYDPNGGESQDFYKHIYNLLNDKKELSAASDIPVIANNFIKLPFMGVITGASTEHWYDLKGSDINTTTDEQQWGMTADGWQSNDGSTPVINPMNPNITGPGGGGSGQWCSRCQQSIIITLWEEHQNQHRIEDVLNNNNNNNKNDNGGNGFTLPPLDKDDGQTVRPGDGTGITGGGTGDETGGGTGITGGGTGDYRTINAANGIVYTFAKGEMELYKDLNENGEPKYDKVDFLSIAMSVPSPKNKNNAAEGYNLMYIPNSGYPLIPYSGQELAKIAERIDILSYVIDDGETGRMGPNGNYKPLKRYTFKEAVCHYNPKGYRVKPNSIDVSIMTGGAYTTCEENCLLNTDNNDLRALEACYENCGYGNQLVTDPYRDTDQIRDENDDSNENGSYYVDLFGCPEGIEPVQGALQLVGPRR